MEDGWVRIRGWRPFGAELRLHSTLLLLVCGALLVVARDPAFMALVLAAYFLALVVHEGGHALGARRLGYLVTRLEFSPFHGRCCFFGEPSPRNHFLIALAGPAAQLCLAAVVFALGAVPTIREWDPFGPVYVFGGYFNVVWASINLIPVRGFDGDVIWRELLRRLRQRRSARSKPPLRRVK